MDNQHISSDGLKWFGEGFDGFPKRLPDDCMEYKVFIVSEEYENNVTTTRKRLNEILHAANSLIKKHFHDFIWQRDSFELRLYPKSHFAHHNIATCAEVPAPALSSDSNDHGQPVHPHLAGRTNFGDSITDEWHIVWALVQLSKQFPEAWIRMYDTDGEFLLIEGAGALPKWLNPDVAENRVWVNDGRIRIIPLDDDPGSPSKKPPHNPATNLTTSQALARIFRSKSDLLHIPALDAAALQRLATYPSAIAASMHNALVTIPRRLAYILHHSDNNSRYISPAIEAFYLRDPISLRPLATKDLATLSFPPEDFVTVSVRFSRVGYAQLRGQVMERPPPAWSGVVPKLLLAEVNGKHDEKSAMGMKLTCGFEMLKADSKNRDLRCVREMNLLLEDLESGDEVLPTDEEIREWPQVQDDEAWLEIDYADFEKELSGEQNNGRQSKPAGDTGDAQENLHKLVSRFRDFMNDEDADAEGIDDDDDSNGDSDGDDESDDDNEIDSDINPQPGQRVPSTSTSTTNPQTSSSPNPPSASAPPPKPTTEAAQFTASMQHTAKLPAAQLESSGLLAEARKLAQQDGSDAEDPAPSDPLTALLRESNAEISSDGLIRRKPKPSSTPPNFNSTKPAPRKPPPQTPHASQTKPFFGPPRPPHLLARSSASATVAGDSDSESDASFVGPGDLELSSDDEEFNDVDVAFARNMLASLQGQQGLGGRGPAGNLMRNLGVGLPRDEGDEGDFDFDEGGTGAGTERGR